MEDAPLARRMTETARTFASFSRFQTESRAMRKAGQPGVSNFIFGNPQEMPQPGLVAAFQKWIVPQHKDWYAYIQSQPGAQAAVAAGLRERLGVPFEPDDITMTTGAFAGLTLALNAVVDPCDEVIFISPPWFFYEAIIVASGGKPVRVKVDPQTFDLDLQAIAASIGERTRAITVNSPNNPTGKIYPPQTLRELARILTAASERTGRTIYLVSDEAYSHIVFDGRSFPSPACFYPNTFLIYTYGKTLQIPGQRIGYIALPPEMPHREQVQQGLFTAQVEAGYAYPNAMLQYALPELEKLSVDIAGLQCRRDRLVRELRKMGYSVHMPEGTFYLLPRSPWSDDWAFVDRLAEREVLCLPGSVAEMPGYFRISLTASDDMLERALPGFRVAISPDQQA